MSNSIIPIAYHDDNEEDELSILSYEDRILTQESLKPSLIIKNDDNNYETGSDESGYDENLDFKVIHMRRPSVVRKSLQKFNKSIHQRTIVGSNLIPVTSRPSIARYLKTKIFLPILISISLITGVIIIL